MYEQRYSLYEMAHSRYIINQTKETIAGQAMIWIAFWTTDFLFTYGFQRGQAAVIPFIFNSVTNTVYFYACVFYIILPWFSKSRALTLVTIFILLLAFVGIKMEIEKFLHTSNYTNNIERRGSIIPYISFELWRYSYMTFFSFAYWYYLKSVREEQLRRRMEEKLFQTEIAFLKAQINPHFLLNTLNFVYNDVAGLSHRSGEAILSLTRLMRYSVESTMSEQNTVEKELEAVEEYLKLQELRFGKRLAVNYQRRGSLLLFSIPPLILLTLVENAFKYGIHDDPADPITLDIGVNSSGLTFRCRNKKRLNVMNREVPALGYMNIRRRLEIAFPDHFILNTKDSFEYFEVELEVSWLPEGFFPSK